MRYGDVQVLSHQHALAFVRHAEKETVLVVLNYDTASTSLTLPTGKPNSHWRPLSGTHTAQQADQQGNLTLQPAGLSVTLYQLQ